MTGMKVPTSAGISGYDSHTVTIEVTGVRQQAVLKTGRYQTRVPYSQMSQALQTIHKQGGKIASVQLMNNLPATATPPEVDNGEDVAESASESVPPAKRQRRRG